MSHFPFKKSTVFKFIRSLMFEKIIVCTAISFGDFFRPNSLQNVQQLQAQSLQAQPLQAQSLQAQPLHAQSSFYSQQTPGYYTQQPSNLQVCNQSGLLFLPNLSYIHIHINAICIVFIKNVTPLLS